MSPSARSLVDLASELHQRYPDEWLDALANERRLILVKTLRSVETPIEKATVARHVAATETDRSFDAVGDEVVRTVLIALHHHHLPRLADLGIIDYSERTGTIEALHIHEDVNLLEA